MFAAFQVFGDFPNPVRHRNCEMDFRMVKLPEKIFGIAYFKLARCLRLCLNAFDEQKKA
jgi:hypothetical protein